jgi:nucleoside-diphosphate-sugar epimerase
VEMNARRLIVTGASGFFGRHLLEALKDDHRVFGIARRPQRLCGAPEHPNISWHQADIRDREGLAAEFAKIRKHGTIDALVHLAAHYDFKTDNPELYWQTNVDGLRNTLEEAERLQPRFFVFASSIAACRFPPRGRVIDETSAPDGRHPYARTKCEGERMVEELSRKLPCCIIRFAAMFSDWCEYPPMFIAFQTWLSDSWRRRVVGGRGRFAIPYLHVSDGVRFVLRVLERAETLRPATILLATEDEAVSAARLYREATAFHWGEPETPLHIPKAFCAAGIRARDTLGRLLGRRPFEQPWMSRYIDRQLSVDSSQTRAILQWEPRERLTLLRRLPFLIENLKTNPIEWNRRNHAAMSKVELSLNLQICRLLERHSDSIRRQTAERIRHEMQIRRLPGYRHLSRERLDWLVQVALRHLISSVRTRDKGVYISYCHDLARRSFALGFSAEEVCGSQRLLRSICLRTLTKDATAANLVLELKRQVYMTIMFGCDQVLETYELLELADGRSSALPEHWSESGIPVGSSVVEEARAGRRT